MNETIFLFIIHFDSITNVTTLFRYTPKEKFDPSGTLYRAGDKEYELDGKVFGCVILQKAHFWHFG